MTTTIIEAKLSWTHDWRPLREVLEEISTDPGDPEERRLALEARAVVLSVVPALEPWRVESVEIPIGARADIRIAPEARFAESAVVRSWGAARGARRVSGLTREERELVRAGAPLYIAGAPPAFMDGVWTTIRRVVYAHGAFYTRVPKI